MNVENKGMMFILSSPSGAGKTTLTKKIAEENSNFKISISHTTRTPRPNEENGKDYYFVSNEEFNDLIKKESFFEHAKIFENLYGTLKKPVIKFINEGKDVLFDIDWQGTQQIKKNKNLNLVTFFILPPNLDVLKKRLLNRHEGQEKLIKERMNKFNEEVSHWKEYDYIVINDELDKCYKQLIDIILSEKKGLKLKQNLEKISLKVNQLIK